MPLNGAMLGQEIAAAVNALTPAQKANVQNIWTAVGNAVVAHIVANGVVNVTVTTAGTAAAQAGTGAGTIA